jgi:hypothetical protein
LLKRLAAACPASENEAATRLWLKAVAAGPADGAGDDAARRADRARLVALLDDARRAREQFDVLVTNSAELARAVTARGTPARTQVLAAFERTLQRFEHDAALSRADRIGALAARVELARIDVPPAANGRAPTVAGSTAGSAPAAFRADDALLADVRDTVAVADREITDGYERQAVITGAAEVLERAGLLGESDTLLKANLAKSHSPYYLMAHLAANAKKRGDKADALRWSQTAFDKAEGPATRLQWGAGYVSNLVELAPQDEARIEAAAARLFDEAAAQPNAFYERSARSLQKVGTKLQGWNKGRAHAAVLQRLQSKLDGVCAALAPGDPQRAVCEGLLKPADAARRSA